MKAGSRTKDDQINNKIQASIPTSNLSATDASFFSPLLHSSKLFYLFIGILASIVSFAIYAFSTQFQEGLIVTGLREPIFWGLYMSNFVFFIGISHAGTLISAILRLAQAEWRRPIVRMAESITVMAIMVGALFPIIDMGRPDRVVNVLFLGRIQSPILWDFLSIATYLTGSLIYLYLPLIPDIAEARDKLTDASKIKKWLYKKLALGWTGTKAQKKRLNRGIGVMAIIIVPVAVSVHTVVSWAFAMNLRVGWHTPLFGPYFVGGAIFSGIAAIIVVMFVFRKVYHLENYIKYVHFKNLAFLLLTLNIVMIYFVMNEFLVNFYGGEILELYWLNLFFNGTFTVPYFTYVAISLIIPAIIISFPRTRTINGIVFASLLVVFGMWLERFLLVVPTLATPIMPYPEGIYIPSWVEWSITAGAFAFFIMAYSIFTRIFPIISKYEIAEGEEKNEKNKEKN